MVTILFADNDPDFLETRREFLTRDGYSIISASNPAEARRHLEQGGIDLAILDIRMVNDDDDRDVSGLTLAKEPAYYAIPKIILTGFPSVQAVREALGPVLDGLPPAVDFVAKSEGPLVLAQAIQQALAALPTRVQDVFIVHGHDDISRETTARLIQHLGLRPIILSEQPARGRTIVDQIEHYARVGFVIVLLTPDDVGYPKGQPKQKAYRARQNVIFELGFFVGKLGRSRVCVLFQEGVEIPSDYRGVLYIPMDAGSAWKLRLAREMKEAGIRIDMKRILDM